MSSPTMKAVVYYGPGDVRVEQVPPPRCGDGELLVKVDACAVCASDLKSFKVLNPRMEPPLTLGHEFTGLIEQIGAGAEGFAIGERVVMATTISCGECFYCRRGWPNICLGLAPMGFAYDGGMAEYVVIPARAVANGHVVEVPPGLRPEHAALSEPVSCVVNSMGNCGIEEDQTVVVVGAGPMGLMNACVARAMGAGKIILSEISEKRLELARQFDVDVLVNSAERDLRQVVMDETDGLGADVAIVAAPEAAPQEMAVGLVRKRGTVCLFASLPKGRSAITIDSRPLHYGELRLVGTSDSTPRHVKAAVELLASGKVPVEKLVTHILPLDDVHKAFELMTAGEALRVVLKP
ncbi:MAG: alcohol dehydrogenase catalytic domain-containing protein [Phycisphaerae bacterium]